VYYKGFVTISTLRLLPVITGRLNYCLGDPITLSTTATGINYEWVFFDGAPNVARTFGPSPTKDVVWTPSITRTTVYDVRLRVEDSCCGWSVPVYALVDVFKTSSVTFSGLNAVYCPNDPTSILTPSPSGICST